MQYFNGGGGVDDEGEDGSSGTFGSIRQKRGGGGKPTGRYSRGCVYTARLS